MISLHTPPGAKIICIRGRFNQRATGEHVDVLTVGAIYTVARWHVSAGLYFVVLEEAGWRGFNRNAFNPIALPDCLTSILDRVPIDTPARELDGVSG